MESTICSSASHRTSSRLPRGAATLYLRLAAKLSLRFRYTDAVDSHFVASVLHALPKQYESILKQIDDGDDENRSFDMSVCRDSGRTLTALTLLPVPEPNLNSHVILRVKEDRKNVELGDESCVLLPLPSVALR